MQNTSSKADSLPPRAYGGQGHAERAAERRERFIKAGIELFGTVGYLATTMRTLTAEAGLTNRYFYESFETMEDLLIACHGKLMGDYLARLRSALDAAPDNLEEQIRAGLRCYLEEMREPRFARITQREVVGISPRIDALYERTIRDLGALLMQYIGRDSKGAISIPKRKMELICEALAGAASFAGAMWMRSRYSDSIETVVDATATILLGTARLINSPQK